MATVSLAATASIVGALKGNIDLGEWVKDYTKSFSNSYTQIAAPRIVYAKKFIARSTIAINVAAEAPDIELDRDSTQVLALLIRNCATVACTLNPTLGPYPWVQMLLGTSTLLLPAWSSLLITCPDGTMWPATSTARLIHVSFSGGSSPTKYLEGVVIGTAIPA